MGFFPRRLAQAEGIFFLFEVFFGPAPSLASIHQKGKKKRKKKKQTNKQAKQKGLARSG